MKSSLVAFVAFATAVYALASCGSGVPPILFPDASNNKVDSGTNNGNDSGNNTGVDSGTNNNSDSGTTNNSDGGATGAALGQYCTMNGSTPCPNGYVCIFQQGAAAGQCAIDCTAGASACPGGSTCISEGANSFCFEDCTNTCPAGQICVMFQGATGTFCAADCTVHADECPTSSWCNPAFKLCEPVGTTGYAGECGATGSSACQMGLTCIGTSAGHGFCSQPCSATMACPTTPAGAQCVNVTLPTNFCVYICTGGGTCPTGLTCITATGGSVCE